MVNLWTKGMLFCVVGMICLNTEFFMLLQKALNFINLITLNMVSSTRISFPFWSWEIKSSISDLPLEDRKYGSKRTC